MAELKPHREVLRRVSGDSLFTAIPDALKYPNVRKFRKFPPFHRPVMAFSELLVGSYTKIVTRIAKKMLS